MFFPEDFQKNLTRKSNEYVLLGREKMAKKKEQNTTQKIKN